MESILWTILYGWVEFRGAKFFSRKFFRDENSSSWHRWVDWEYPAKCTVDCSPESDAARFRKLCEKFRSEINAENVSNKMLVTAAVGIGKDKIYPDPGNAGHTVPSYNPKHLTDYLDFVNLMSYDMHGHWDSETGHQVSDILKIREMKNFIGSSTQDIIR